MLYVISPSKTLDFETPVNVKKHSQILFADDAQKLVNKLQKLSQKKILGRRLQILSYGCNLGNFTYCLIIVQLNLAHFLLEKKKTN